MNTEINLKPVRFPALRTKQEALAKQEPTRNVAWFPTPAPPKQARLKPVMAVGLCMTQALGLQHPTPVPFLLVAQPRKPKPKTTCRVILTCTMLLEPTIRQPINTGIKQDTTRAAQVAGLEPVRCPIHRPNDAPNPTPVIAALVTMALTATG